MEHFGAGLAALGVLGPGIGIGILAGMPDAILTFPLSVSPSESFRTTL